MSPHLVRAVESVERGDTHHLCARNDGYRYAPPVLAFYNARDREIAEGRLSTLTDILDRLTDIGTLRSQIGTLVKEQNELRSVVLQQQREIAEVRGQLKAMIPMRVTGDKTRLK